METVAKLLKFNKSLFAKITEMTQALRNSPKGQTPDELRQARDFIRNFARGEVPQTVILRHNELISSHGRAAADEWLQAQREAHKAESARLQAQVQALKDKGFQLSIPNESQTIALLLQWAVENAPADILTPSRGDLDSLVPRTPPDDLAPPTKAPKTNKAARR